MTGLTPEERFANHKAGTKAAWVVNHSGTLSLELWALSAPFTGGHFEGHHLAGVEIGSVNGQSELVLQPLDLAFIPPPAGDWHFVLMLREWTCEGFVTRDFTSLATSFISAPLLGSPVVFAEEIPVAVAEETVAPVVAKASAEEEDKAATPASSGKAPSETSVACVSVNTAVVEELAAVKGLSVKTAEAIVKKRPFTSLDDLRRVKGLGTKVLAKARSSLKL
jgi:competence ComEA-like helix-hairpin-helix protein